MKEFISVIVPVYNVAHYLPQCLDSLIAQTYTALEIILIDDGSTDGSSAICDAYAARDSRIRVIHQKNGGAANAKNAGLRIATGEYLAFADSDDWVETDAYEHMLNLLKGENADAVQCSFRNVYTDGAEVHMVTETQKCLQTEEYLLRYTTDWTCGLLWDKLYKRSLFAGIYFEEGHKIDDEFFTYRGIMNATKIVHDPQIVYNYRQRGSSVTLTAANGERFVMDKLDYLPVRRERISSKFPMLKTAFDLHYLDMLLFLSRDPYATEESLQREKRMLADYFRETDATKPPIGAWLALWKLWLTPAKWLLNKRRIISSAESGKYFP